MARLLVALAMVGSLAVDSSAAENRPSADGATSRAVAAAAAEGPALGVQFHGLWSSYDREKRAAVLDRIAASGARWVRLDVGWPMIQPRAGEFDLRWGVPLVDQVVRQARARGLKVLGTFWLTPDWAGSGGERALPRDPGSYAAALAWAERRWRGDIAAWEVWNEPNSGDFLVGADPVGYTRLLCTAYRAAGGGATKIVFGGLMYNDDAWLRRAYAAGAAGCFDVMATHPYMAPSDAPPELPDDGTIWRLRHLDAIRALMLANGDDKPVWATEFGWSAHPTAAGAPPWKRGVSEAVQGDYALRTLALLGRDHPYVRKAFWYNDVVKTTGDQHEDGYGMLGPDLRPRPLFGALRSALR